VTGVALTCIVLASLSTVGSAVQCAILALWRQQGLWNTSFAELPAPMRFVLEHAGLLSGLAAVASIVALAAGIGLLRRQNWARCAVVALLGLGIAVSLAGALLPVFAPMPAIGAAGLPGAFDLIRGVMLAMGGVTALAISVLLGWLIARLLSPAVRHEFRAS